MRKARFTEHQIIAVLQSVEVGRTVKDVCCEAAISEASYYDWEAKYTRIEDSDISAPSTQQKFDLFNKASRIMNWHTKRLPTPISILSNSG